MRLKGHESISTEKSTVIISAAERYPSMILKTDRQCNLTRDTAQVYSDNSYINFQSKL